MAVFIIAGVVMFTGNYVLYVNFRQLQNQQSWVMHTLAVIDSIEKTIAAKETAVSAGRAYLLSGNPKYLDAHYAGVTEAQSSAENVVNLTYDSTEQNSKAKNLKSLVDKRIELLGFFVEKRIKSKMIIKDDEYESNAAKTNATEIAIMAAANEMKNFETDLLKRRQISADNIESKFYASLIANALIILLTVGFGFFVLRRLDRKTEEELLQKTNESLLNQYNVDINQLIQGEDNIQEISQNILNYLCQKFELPCGRIALQMDNSIKVTAEIAINKNNDEKSESINLDKKSFAQYKTLSFIHNVPSDFWKIESSLGEALPKVVVILPLIVNNETIGIIEFGSFSEMSEQNIEHLTHLGNSLSNHFFVMISNHEMKQLLEKTQDQASRLQLQQEELSATNEELEQQAQYLETQISAVSTKNSQLEILSRSLENQRIDLQKANQYKADFLARMSHELRTPLNGLLILSQLLFENKEGTLTEQQKKYSLTIKNAGIDLLNLVNDILDLSKIEARKLRLQTEQVRIAEIMNIVAEGFKPLIEEKGIAFKVNIKPEVKDQIITTDRIRLKQVIRNFLSNATKFTLNGTISLIVGYNPKNKSEILIEVTDTGIGIDSKKLDIIFEAFEQAETTTSRRFGGTGLGLTISREIATMLGGRIEVKSTMGEGSTFSLFVPIEMPEQQIQLTQESLLNRKQETSTTTSSNPESVLLMSSRAANAIIIASNDTETVREVSQLVKVQFPNMNLEVCKDSFELLKAMNEQKHQIVICDSEFNEHHIIDIFRKIDKENLDNNKFIIYSSKIPTEATEHELYQYVHDIIISGNESLSRLKNALQHLQFYSSNHNSHRLDISKQSNEVSESDYQNKRILIVDDDLRNIFALTNALESRGLSVVSATNGKEALKVLSREKEISLVITDLMMPEMDGFELIKNIRNSNEPYSRTPIITLSAKTMKDDKAASLAAGANEYMTKPVELRNLESTINTWLINS